MTRVDTPAVTSTIHTARCRRYKVSPVGLSGNMENQVSKGCLPLHHFSSPSDPKSSCSCALCLPRREHHGTRAARQTFVQLTDGRCLLTRSTMNLARRPLLLAMSLRLAWKTAKQTRVSSSASKKLLNEREHIRTTQRQSMSPFRSTIQTTLANGRSSGSGTLPVLRPSSM